MRDPASKSKVKEAKEIAQVLRTLPGLVKGGSSVPRTHVRYLTTAYNPRSMRSDTLLTSMGTFTIHTHTFKKLEIKTEN